MRQASNAAPEFAAGHSMLAKHLAFVATDIAPDQALRTEAEREARRSLELDPKDPDAFVTFGLLAPELDFVQREKFFRLALASNPAWPHANGFLANVMTDVGRLQDAETLYQRAAAVNPQSIDWTIEAVDGLVNAGQAAEADRELARIAQLWPNDVVVWDSQMASLTAQKRWSDGLKLLDTAGNFGAAISPSWVVSRRRLMTALQSSDPVQRNALRQELMTSSNTDPQTAIVRLAMLGFVDDAFTVAANYHPGNSDFPSFLFQPEAAELRNDPRFMALAARFKLIDYWRRTARWPDFCRDPGLPYNCVSQAQEIIGRSSHR